MLKTTITAGMLLAVAFLFTAWMPAPAQALMSKHRCDFCHDLHSAAGGSLTNRATTEAVCRACHASSVDGRTYGTDTDAVLTVAAAVHTGSHFNVTISCLGCHNPHDYEPTDDPTTTTEETNDGDRDSYQNLDLVRRTITVMETDPPGSNLTAIFTTIPGDYATSTYTGICQVCHTRTTAGNSSTPRMRYDSGFDNHASSQDGDCMACHPHSNGFDR